MEQLKGYIEHFVFHNSENGYTVMQLNTDDGVVTCVGIVQGFGEGEDVELQGEYVVHPVYSRQFKFSSIKGLPPENTTAILRYLGSGAIKGIGESLAKRIVKTFGKDTFRIAQEEPERLAEVKGISLKKAYDIGEQIAEKRDVRDAMIFLQGFGISQNLSNKIYKKYGTELYRIIKENPYKLSEDIAGVGFKIADEIAEKSGIVPDSDYRIRCGLLHALMESAYNGHIYYPVDKLKYDASTLLGVDIERMEKQLLDLLMDKKLIIKKYDDGDRAYLPAYYYAEKSIAKMLSDISLAFHSDVAEKSVSSIKEKISVLEKQMNIVLDDLQKEAVVNAVRNGVFVLTGGPGTGKTTTINMILELFKEYDLEFALAAPTGRAAKRMQETTGYEAKTLHRLLEINGDIDEGKKQYFDRNEENPLEYDAIIVDEMSMVDVFLFKALVSAVAPGTRLILVGDSYQLHSVGAGQILKDILDCGKFLTICLEKIFRQDNESHIVQYAYDINHGNEIDFKNKYRDFFLLEKDSPEVIYKYIEQLVKVNVPKEFNIDPLDIQILAPMKKGFLGTGSLNKELQSRLNPPANDKQEYTYGECTYREGDKVMQVKNNYDLEWEIVGKYNLTQDSGKGVFNGDIGIIRTINCFNKTMLVEFDDKKQVYYPFENLDELELSYAVTIHKSQGSEYPVVIMPLLSGPTMLMTRNLLYTGVTRAKECVIMLGSANTVNAMINNNVIEHRYTSLAEQIEEYMDNVFGGEI